jgi:hypothetical protein
LRPTHTLVCVAAVIIRHVRWVVAAVRRFFCGAYADLGHLLCAGAGVAGRCCTQGGSAAPQRSRRPLAAALARRAATATKWVNSTAIATGHARCVCGWLGRGERAPSHARRWCAAPVWHRCSCRPAPSRTFVIVRARSAVFHPFSGTLYACGAVCTGAVSAECVPACAPRRATRALLGQQTPPRSCAPSVRSPPELRYAAAIVNGFVVVFTFG